MKTAQASRRTPAKTKASASRADVIPWLAAAATLWAAVLPLWPGLGVVVVWSSVVFGGAAAVVAVFVARTGAKLRGPGGVVPNAMTAGVLALVVIVPVVFDPRTMDSFNLAKLTAVLIASLAIAAAWAVEAVTTKSWPRWRNGLHWPVVALVAWTTLATVTSVSPRFSLLGAQFTNDGLLAVVGLAVIFFAVVQAVTTDQVKAVLAALYLGAGGLTLLYGLIQLHDRVFGGTQWDWIRQVGGQGMESFAAGRIFSTFANPNHLGGFLAILAPVGLVLLLLHRSRRMRILILVVMAGVLVELLQTTSWGALLAAVVALGIAAALLWPELRRRPKVAVPAVAAVVAAVAIVAVGLAAVPRFSDKLSAGVRPGAALTLRADLWRVGIAMANDRPLVGHGPDTWIDRAPRHQDPDAVKRHGPQGYYSNGAHNLFVSQLAATGYPGLILLLGVVAVAAMRAVGTWRRLRQIERDGKDDDKSRAREARLCLVAVVTGLAAFLVQASFNLSQIGLSFVFWVLLALLCVLSLGVGVPTGLRAGALIGRPPAPAQLASDVDRPTATRARGRHTRSARGPDVVTVPVAIAACVGLAFALSFASRPLRADHNAGAWSYDSVVARGAPPEEAARLSARAATRLDNAIRLNPWEPSYRANRADGLHTRSLSAPVGSALRRTLLQDAARDYERVVDLRPYGAGYLVRYANILLRLHEADPADGQARAQAIRLLQRAVDADPHSTARRDLLQRVLAG